MRAITLVGVLLIIFGIFTFMYKGFTYTKQEKVAQVGSVQISADTQETVYFSPMVGGIALVAGAFLVFMGRK